MIQLTKNKQTQSVKSSNIKKVLAFYLVKSFNDKY
jgi:hypothetical protein